MAIKLNITTKQNASLDKMSYLLVPFLWFAILIVVSYFVAKTGISKIQSQRQQVVSAKRTETILADKEKEIKGVRNYEMYVQPVSVALPNKNPALILISVMRDMSTLYNVTVTDLRFGSGGGRSGFPQVSIGFGMVGTYNDFISFLDATKTTSPLLTLESVEFSILEDNTSGEVNLNSYYSDYPDKLPAITEPIKKLTPENINTLKSVYSFKPPVFNEIPPSGPYGRTNPFL